jgi:long-chain acyl-CoA synthetase
VIVYTSGTTGRPKGAELMHFQLYMNADIPGRLFDVREDDIIITVLPLFHVFGLSSILNIAVRFGCTMSLIPRFEAGTVLAAIQQHRATIFEGVPTMFMALLQHPQLDQFDVASLRVAISGGAAIPAQVLDAFEDRFGVVVLEATGCRRPHRRPRSTAAPPNAAPTASASPSGARSCRSGTTRGGRCRRAATTSVSWSPAGST